MRASAGVATGSAVIVGLDCRDVGSLAPIREFPGQWLAVARGSAGGQLERQKAAGVEGDGDLADAIDGQGQGGAGLEFRVVAVADAVRPRGGGTGKQTTHTA